MAKYHINPKTGNPSRCRAEQGGCPFGSESEHHTSIEASRKSFEERMENQELFLHFSEVPITKGAHMLGAFNKFQDDSEELMPGYYSRQRMIETLYGDIPVAEGTRLVIENGTVAEAHRDELTGELRWAVRDNREFMNLEEDELVSGAALLGALKNYGGRFEIGGEAPRLKEKELAYRYPSPRDYSIETELIRKDLQAADFDELYGALDDHIAERWHGRPPKEFEEYREALSVSLGEPKQNAEGFWSWESSSE